MKSATPVPWDIRLMQATAAMLMLVFAGLVAYQVIGGVARLGLFTVSAVSVHGEVAHSNAVTVRANVMPHLGGSIMTLDLQHTRSVFEALPWVRHAIVRREFPNRLRVTLQEHHAIAYWGDEAEPRLMNNFGEVFEANIGEVDKENLPRLIGPSEQASAILATYQTLAPEFAVLDFSIDQLELSARGAWRVQLDNGATLELGSGTVAELRERVARFVHTLTQVASRHGRRVYAVESADLRYAQGYALRLQGVSTVTGASAKKQ